MDAIFSLGPSKILRLRLRRNKQLRRRSDSTQNGLRLYSGTQIAYYVKMRRPTRKIGSQATSIGELEMVILT